jgi:CelD/BcsL family acetyltransferase involved in cellulose biosynthesis
MGATLSCCAEHLCCCIAWQQPDAATSLGAAAQHDEPPDSITAVSGIRVDASGAADEAAWRAAWTAMLKLLHEKVHTIQ